MGNSRNYTGRKPGWLFIVVAVLLGVVIGLGGATFAVHVMLDRNQRARVAVVYGKQGDKAIRAEIKRLDTKAFQPSGYIQSYKVDRESIRADSSQGGIRVMMYANGDKSMGISTTLRRQTHNHSDMSLDCWETSTTVTSKKLSDLLESRNEQWWDKTKY